MADLAAAARAKNKNEPAPSPISVIDVPVSPSEEAIQFMKSITEDDYNGLIFDDQLATVVTRWNNKKVGEYTVAIQHAIKRGDKCFLVKAKQTGVTVVEGEHVECSHTLQGYITYNLETLSQVETYFLKSAPTPYEVKTTLEIVDDDFVLRKQITERGEAKETVRKCEKEKLAGFLSDSASFLLHRLFMRKLKCTQIDDADLQDLPDEVGHFRFLGLDTDHKIAETRYKYLGTKLQVVSNQEIIVYGFERSILTSDPKKMPVIIEIFLLKDAHLVVRAQLQSPLLSRLEYLPELAERDQFLPVPVSKKQPINWQEDGELMMKYADRKDALKADYQLYMREHPEFKALIADFLQLLLMQKPDHPIDFAREYFESFSTKARRRTTNQ